MGSLHFESTDVGEVEDFLSTTYSSMGIGAADPSSTRARVTRHLLGPDVEFHDLDYGFDLTYDAEPPDRIFVGEILSNTLQTDEDAENPATTHGPGDQFIVMRPGLPYSGVAHATRFRLTAIDPGLLAQVAGTPDDPVRLTGSHPISSQARARLQGCLGYLRNQVLAEMGAEPSPLLVATASQHLAATLLHTYPSTVAATAVESQERQDARPTTLARAVAFIEAHPDRELSVADIARAAYVTPRTLQLAFRRHLDTTPMAYLRRVRLDHARRDLERHTPASATVGAIAARWGFTQSRFSQDYQAAYGELPSRTLRG